MEECTRFAQILFKRWQRIIFPILTLVFIMAGILIGISQGHPAHASGATLQVPSSGVYHPSSSIKVQGFNYTANENVKIYWNYTGPGTGTLEVTATADSSGKFTTNFPEPLAATATYTIAGIGQTSNLVATGQFTLLPLMLSTPLAGGVGTKITFKGNAFGAGEQINIYWNSTGPGTGSLLTTTTGNSTGSFTVIGTVPSGTTPGLIPITGIGQTSNTFASHNFQLYAPTLALAPLNGSAGTPVMVSAYGFKATEQVAIYWNNGSTPVTIVTSDTNGYVAPTTLTVPAATAPGSYPVKAVGQSTLLSITNTFAVVAPGSSLNPTSGPSGVSVSATGQGYAPNEIVNVLWNYTGPGTGTTIASITAGLSGTVNGGITVPSSATGAYTVALVGATSNAVTQQTFNVNNGLASSPSTLSPNTSVTVTGEGFQVGDSVQIYWDSSSGTLLATATADTNGNVSQLVTIPVNATPGSHSLVAIGQIGGQSYSAPITVDTGWGDFGFDYANHRENAAENTLSTANVANLKLKWTANIGTNFEGSPSPVYANGTLYIVSTTGILSAYNATSGALQWQFDSGTGFPNLTTPVVDSAANLVFFGTIGSQGNGIASPFYALNIQTGALVWSLIIPGDEYGFPTLASHTIYVGVANEGSGLVLAIDDISGNLLWQYNPRAGVWGAIGVNTSTNTLFTGTGNPNVDVLALNATTGALIWQHPIQTFNGDDDIGSAMAIANGMVYVDSKNGNMYALDQSTGTQLWSAKIGPQGANNVASPAVSSGGVVYIGSRNSNIYALNASTGAVVWKKTTGPMHSSPVLANGVVYVGSDNQIIYAMNASTGKVLWSYTTGAGVFSSPIVVNGWLYCGSNDGKLYAFSL